MSEAKVSQVRTPKRRMTMTDRIRRSLAQGMSPPEIAKKYKVDANYVRQIRWKMVDALEKIYRVEVFDDKLIVLSFGMEMEDLDGSYKSIDELPQWMRDRLHVLSMMDYKPPTTTVKGVGRRISREVFWVVSE